MLFDQLKQWRAGYTLLHGWNWKHAKWTESRKGHVVYDTSYRTRLEEANLLRQKPDQWLPGAGGCGRQWKNGSSRVQALFEKRWLHLFVYMLKNQRATHFKWWTVWNVSDTAMKRLSQNERKQSKQDGIIDVYEEGAALDQGHVWDRKSPGRGHQRQDVLCSQMINPHRPCSAHTHQPIRNPEHSLQLTLSTPKLPEGERQSQESETDSTVITQRQPTQQSFPRPGCSSESPRKFVCLSACFEIQTAGSSNAEIQIPWVWEIPRNPAPFKYVLHVSDHKPGIGTSGWEDNPS